MAVRVSPDLLRASCHGVYSDAVQGRFVGPLARACEEFGISGRNAVCAFLATVAHETASFRYLEEVASGEAYEGRRDLGNIQTGDGMAFKGRGLIQLTGRTNYTACAQRFQIELAGMSEWLLTPIGAARSAAWFFVEYRPACMAAAQAGDIDAVTRVVNGGLNGIGDRRARFASLLKATATDTLGVAQEQPPAPVEERGVIAEDSTVDPMTIGLGLGLVRSLIDAFSPLAREKIGKEINRHADDKTIGPQVAAAVLETAQRITAQPDPVQAVAAAKADPVLRQKVEAEVLADFERMAPMLDRLAALEQAAWAAEERSRESAREHMVRMLDRGGWQGAGWGVLLALLALIIIGGGGAILYDVLTHEKTDAVTRGGIIDVLKMIIVLVVGFFFGSSRSSQAKDEAARMVARSRGGTD